MGRILIGTSSWADPSLQDSWFYPSEIKTPEDRLRYYSANFPITEIDSTYHILAGQKNISSWIEETPPEFVFDLKVFSLFTQHPTPLTSIPKDLRDKIPEASIASSHVYLHNLPEDAADELWKRFAKSIEPLASAGKLGLIMFQFPPWFHAYPENYAYLVRCREKLPDYRLAVEFRTRGWLKDENEKNTLQFLRDNKLCLVCVDEPQGFRSSLPAIAETTADIAAVRFHGRNVEAWEQKDVPAAEKFNYLYNEEELKEWAPRIRGLAEKAQSVHVIFKNKHLDFAVNNARQMREMLK
jgi:uncharacterized protein YecE (DUF72 family)